MNLRLITEGVGDSIIPKKYRKIIFRYFQKAGIKKVPYFKFGLFTYFTIIVTIVLTFFFIQTKYFLNFPLLLKIVFSIICVIISSFFLISFIIYIFKLFLDIKIYHKVKQMEEVFPEFLSELSLNLKAGLSLEQALENSMEKEFGHLNDEISLISKKATLGKDIDKAIKEFTGNFNSDMIEEAFELIILSWKKGAKTPPLIDRIASNIQENRYLRKKIIASVTSYRIFLMIVTVIITPALFALSFYLINLIRSIINKLLSVSSNVVLEFPISAVRINDEHFMWFSLIAIVLIATCSAIITSVIKSGRIKESFVQIFMQGLGAVVCYRICMLLFGIFFSWFNLS